MTEPSSVSDAMDRVVFDAVLNSLSEAAAPPTVRAVLNAVFDAVSYGPTEESAILGDMVTAIYIYVQEEINE